MVHKLSRSVCRRRLERSRVSGVKLLVRGNGREEPVPGTRVLLYRRTVHETMCVELERQECAIKYLKFKVMKCCLQ